MIPAVLNRPNRPKAKMNIKAVPDILVIPPRLKILVRKASSDWREKPLHIYPTVSAKVWPWYSQVMKKPVTAPLRMEGMEGTFISSMARTTTRGRRVTTPSL